MQGALPIIAGAGTADSILQGINANNAAKSAAGTQQELLQNIMQLFQGPIGTSLRQFFHEEMKNPNKLLAPLFGEQENILGNNIAQSMANFRTQEGSATPNLAGSLNDLFESGIQARGNLGGQQAGQAVGMEQSGAEGLGSFMQNFANAMMGISGQYGQAGANVAANQAGNNPFSSLAGLIASNPSGFSQGTGDIGAFLSRLMGQGNVNSSTGLFTGAAPSEPSYGASGGPVPSGPGYSYGPPQ